MALADAVLLGIGLSLGAWEVYALANKTPGDTVSEKLRGFLRIHPVLTAAFVGFSVWFPLHIFDVLP